MGGPNLNKRILVANRGEIAVKILQELSDIGFQTVSISAGFETNPYHARFSDIHLNIEGDTIAETYLNIDKIIEFAKQYDCIAIHPGYGFLSENYLFAQRCEEENIVFIGPSYKVTKILGDKKKAKETAEKLGIPVIKSYDLDEYNDLSQLTFPVLVKATNGGGGRGMRIVHNEEQFHKAFKIARNETEKYFNSQEIYVEKYVENSRHIEVQILGDHYGNIIHLFERECSVQRRFQKIIEEAPSINLSDKAKNSIYGYAVKLMQHLKYNNAGTVEFLVDTNENIYFLEVNTRIQVEYGVTEQITGINIIQKQVNIAFGNQLDLDQNDVKIDGHAMECRICAEDPDNNFMPVSGRICLHDYTDNKNVRVDSGYNTESIVENCFDSMISKVISWGETREKTIRSLRKFLKNYNVHGIKTNISYVNNILDEEDFKKGNVATTYLENKSVLLSVYQKSIPVVLIAGAAFAFKSFNYSYQQNIWKSSFWRLFYHLRFIYNDTEESFYIKSHKEKLEIKYTDKTFLIDILSVQKNFLILFFENKEYNITVSENNKGKYYLGYNGSISEIILKDEEVYNLENNFVKNTYGSGKVVSPLHGIISEILIGVDHIVKKGDAILVIESMKIENTITSPVDGIVDKIDIQIGEQVNPNRVLLEIK